MKSPVLWWRGLAGAILFLLLGADLALANDAALGGSGADLVPLQETRVRMAAEDILLEFEQGSFRVTANYLFENPTDEDATVQVGFPEIVCSHEDGGDCVEANFRDFRTEVNGKEVPLKLGSLSKDHDWAQHLGRVWLFDVDFKAKKLTRIRHTYRVNPGGDVEMNTFTTYVTRSGATWAGTIGKAKFTLRLPPETHQVTATLGKPQFVDPDGPQPYIEATLTKENWEPSEDLFIQFNDSPFAAPLPGKDRLTRSGVPEEHECKYILFPTSAEQKQMCKNLIYALSGYPFKKEALKKYFYGDAPGFALVANPHNPEDPGRYERSYQELPGRDPTKLSKVFGWVMDQLEGQDPESNAAEEKKGTGEGAAEAAQKEAEEKLRQELDKQRTLEGHLEAERRAREAESAPPASKAPLPGDSPKESTTSFRVEASSDCNCRLGPRGAPAEAPWMLGGLTLFFALVGRRASRAPLLAYADDPLRSGKQGV